MIIKTGNASRIWDFEPAFSIMYKKENSKNNVLRWFLIFLGENLLIYNVLQNQIHKYGTISIFDICSKNSNLISVVNVGTGYPAPERI